MARQTCKDVKSCGSNLSAASPGGNARHWGRQLIGGALGALVAGLALAAGSQFGWDPVEPSNFVMWGAAIGAFAASFKEVAQAGAKLTGRKDGPVWLNTLIALLAIGLFLGLIVGLIFLVGWLTGGTAKA